MGKIRSTKNKHIINNLEFRKWRRGDSSVAVKVIGLEEERLKKSNPQQ
jgi:hypothetical protein